MKKYIIFIQNIHCTERPQVLEAFTKIEDAIFYIEQKQKTIEDNEILILSMNLLEVASDGKFNKLHIYQKIFTL